MKDRRVLAFDFGASSGRAVLARYDGETISLEEIHRFSNDPVSVRGTLYWDVLRLYHEIKQGIGKAVQRGGFDAVGIDTWGVDFGLLDRNGNLMENPVHYRDLRTQGVPEELYRVIPAQSLYNRTGIQLMRINTIFQLYALKTRRPELLAQAACLLLIPDLFAFWLTGERRAEYTIASTTQLLDPVRGAWSAELIRALGLPEGLFPPLIDAGERYGTLSPALCGELGCKPVPVIAAATHDTASAVVSVPSTAGEFAYISCGTWSLFGTETAAPVISPLSRRYNFTNEGGFARSNRLLKNIMGLWLIQESRRQYAREGEEVSYADLEREALASAPFLCFIDPDDPAFETPGDLPARIRDYCARTGQPAPRTRGAVMRCIYESLALKYRFTLARLCEITGKMFDALHIVGGGTKDGLLCRMAADACGVRVLAGPAEATAMGNAAVQLLALGEFPDLGAARRAVAQSVQPMEYQPQNPAAWEEPYRRFLAVTGLE